MSTVVTATTSDKTTVTIGDDKVTIISSSSIGPQGLRGDTGLHSIIPGPQGIPGIDGALGIDGVSGDQGIQGIQGIDGVPGDQGIQGVPGIDGSDGAPGIDGVSGDQGIQGIQGIPGEGGGDTTGLLDENAHDVLDHDGLPGVGDHQWKEVVSTASVLPVNSESLLSNQGGDLTEYTHSGDLTVSVPVTGQGFGTYRLVTYIHGSERIYNVYIYSSVAGLPGVDIGVTSHPTSGGSVTFTNINLVSGTPYFFVLVRQVSGWANDGLSRYWNGISYFTEDKIPPITGWVGGVDSYPLRAKIYSATILSYEGDIRAALDTDSIYYFDGTDWHKIGDITGLLNEVSHDVLDHTGLTGVGSSVGTWISSNNTVIASNTQDITINDVFAVLVTRLLIVANDGNNPIDLNYNIDIYTDSNRTQLAYSAVGITSSSYLDQVPWEWFGGTSMYITITNNKSFDIIDLDITLNYRR